MIWIEIDGLPLNAWTTNAFKKIAGNWGETVFVDEDADENIANGRVKVREIANWGKSFGGPVKKAYSLVNRMMGRVKDCNGKEIGHEC
ncbi:RNA-directed DNA polymerase, eukaryota [Tanacetum coccineum]